MILLWKKLWSELRVYKKQFYFVVALGVITSGLKSLTPILFDRLFEAWANKDTFIIYAIPALFSVVWVLGCITRFFHLSKMRFISDRISVDQRKRLMDKYLTLNISYFQNLERGSGGLISRMLNDILVIQNGIQKVADIVREPFVVLFMLAQVIYLEWRLTLFILVALPLVSFVLSRLARSLRKYSKLNQETMEDLTRTLKESLDGTKIIQSFGLESEIRRKFNEQAERFLLSRKMITMREEASGPISEAITSIFLGLVLCYIGQLALNLDFDLKKFTTFIIAMGFLMDSIRKLQDGYIRMQQGGIGLDRFNAILSSRPSVQSPVAPVEFPTDWTTIEFRDVSFAYNEESVIKNINLTIRRSETIALVGSSGSGKSTLVNLLQRFFDPTDGVILIGGIDIRKFDLNVLRKNIALVTQDVFLFNDTIEKNIHMGNLEAPLERIPETAKMANAHNFIEQSPNGYQTSVGDFGNRISGGEKQRISIARAILKNSPILVLDEATSALDSESELEVQKALNQLLEGRTAFVIAHRLSTISKADRIIVMKDGGIVEEGTHNELVEKKGEYFKFHQMQFVL